MIHVQSFVSLSAYVFWGMVRFHTSKTNQNMREKGGMLNDT